MDTNYLMFYYQKWQRGELATSQVAQQLNLTEAEVREEFQKIGGINERKQTLNG